MCAELAESGAPHPQTGRRFVNELGRRDAVSAAVRRLPGESAALLLGRDAAAAYGQASIDFYVRRGLMRPAYSLAQAAELLGCSEEALKASLEEYAAAARSAAEGPGAAMERTGKTSFPHPPSPTSDLPFVVATVTPAVGPDRDVAP
jgi:hypothetical protein